MALSDAAAAALATEIRDAQLTERKALDPIRRYWTGRQKLPPVIPSAAPREVHEMARMARVNVLAIVVDALSQSLFVDGYRGRLAADNVDVWRVWQANRLPSRQSGIHRAALAYGSSYAVVLPGDPLPVIRGVSPRQLTTRYGDDPDWPVYALERGTGTFLAKNSWRLYDEEKVYELTGPQQGEALRVVESKEHGAKVCPVVRFLETEDLDADDEVSDESRRSRDTLRLARGQIAPLMALQDQVDLITFNLLVAQHYSAFRQRYIIGWVADSEEARAKASASQLWTFDEDPERMRVGEFGETNLDGYIKSREASLRHAATLSQTPVHELIGELVNLSAEALAAAEAGRDRKVADRQTLFGESHEQALGLAGDLASIETPQDAQVIWRDTSARAFGAVVDGLGKLVQMLGIPAEELWERVPGATQEDVERWRARAQEGDALGNLAAMLERQAGGAPVGEDAAAIKAKADAMGALIRAGVEPTSAAAQVGLSSVSFIEGAVPVSLRLPERVAAGLEE